MKEKRVDTLLLELAEALRERLKIIADHEFRDRDAAGHLKQLQSASEQIEKITTAIPRQELDPKLRHYLDQRSYNKALEHLT
ncbi:MAG: hypothetical protein ACH346_02465 [Chthoniobacterales bacterium]